MVSARQACFPQKTSSDQPIPSSPFSNLAETACDVFH
jgi:hypothetical protein